MTTDGTRRRRRRKPSRFLTTAGLVGAAALIVGVVWTSMSQSSPPTAQERVTVPGAGEHLVNLWADHADADGGQRLTAQVTDSSGWPVGVDSLVFVVSGAGQEEEMEAPGAYSPEGPGRGQVYNAITELPGSGPWEVAVRFIMAGSSGEALFTLEGD